MFVGVSTALTAVRAILKSFITDGLKLFYNFRDNSPDFLLDGSTSFDGNDYIDTGSSFSGVFGDGTTDNGFTITCWVNRVDNSALDSICGKTYSDLAIRLQSSGKVQVFLRDVGGSAYLQREPTGVVDVGWHHLAVTYDGSRTVDGIKIYGNAVAVSGGNATSGTFNAHANTSSNLHIADTNGGDGLEGDMACFGVWNRELSASEIESIRWRGSYSELKDTELTNLVSWYNLQGDLLDSAGSNNGTNNGATLNSNSYSGKSPFKPRVRDLAKPKMAVQLADGSTSFDGTDDYIDLGSLPVTTNHTISGWARHTGSNVSSILFDSRDANNDGIMIRFESSTGFIQYQLNDNDVENAVNMVNKNWFHYCATYDGSTQKLYINGSLSASSSTSQTVSIATPHAYLGVQYFTSFGSYFQGEMANVAIYSSALTQLQVQELMFAEKYSGLSADLKTNLVSWYDLGSDQLSGTELITNGNFNTDVSSWSSANSGLLTSQDNGVSGTKCLRIQKNGDTNPLAYQDFTTVVGQTYRITYYVKAGTEASSQVAMGETDYSNRTFSGVVETPTEWTQRTHDHVATATTSRLLLYLSNDSASGSETIFYDDVSVQKVEVKDSKGSNDGNIFGATTTTGYTSSPHGVVDPLNFGEVYSGRVLSFDGSNDSIDCGDIGNVFGDSFSVSMWVNPDTVGSRREFIGQYVDNQNFWRWGIDGSGNWEIDVEDNDVRTVDVTPTCGLVASQWQHIVLTRKLSDWNFYLNGQIDGTGSDSSTVPELSTSVTIGNVTGGSEFYDGKINNVKIFNTALTQAQVQEIYTKPEQVLPNGVSASSLKLDLPMQEGSGSYVYDGSPVIGDELNIDSNPTSITNESDDVSNSGWYDAHSAVLESVIVSDGSYALKFVASASGHRSYVDFDGSSPSSNFDLTSGNLYLLSIDLRHTGTGGDIRVAFDDSNGLSTPTETLVTLTSSDTTFNTYTTIFTYSSNYRYFGVKEFNDNNDGGCYIDKFSVKQLSVQNHGTITGATWATGEQYAYQSSLVRSNTPMIFDGSDDTVTISHASNLTFTSGFSISAWVKINTTNSAVGVIEKGKYFLRPWSDGNIYFGWYDSSDTVSNQAYASYSSGSWFHVVGVYNSSDTKNYLYINGSQVNVTSANSITPATDTDSLRIGSRPSGTPTSFLNGLINEVAIWNTSLDADAVTALYNSGVPLLPTSDSGNYDNSEDLEGYWRNDGNTTWTDRTPTNNPELITNGNFSNWTVESGDAFTFNTDGTVTVANTSTTSSIITSFSVVKGRTYRYNVTSTSTSGVGTYFYIKQPSGGFTPFGTYQWSVTNHEFVATSTGTAQLRIWKYGGHTGNGVLNTASIIRYRGGNDGTASGSPVTIVIPEGSTEGRDNQGYLLSETHQNSLRLHDSEYVSVQDSEVLSFGDGTDDTPFSLEAWIKMDDATKFKIFAKGIYNTNAEYVMEVNNDDKLRLILYDEDVADTVEIAMYNTAITSYEGQWIHVCATYNGVGGTSANAGIKLYINGSNVATTLSDAGTFVSMVIGIADVHIGRDDSDYAKGLIDEPLIYSKELSASEVLKNYNSGKSAHQ